MADWQRDFLLTDPLSAYPIKERLRCGLSFELSGGRTARVLQVQPVHYRDTAGEMLPLDTALRPVSADFGAPGFVARLKDNGVVRTNGFRQKFDGVGAMVAGAFVPLFLQGLGLRSDDRFIWESGIYRFETVLTERGVRQQLIVQEKPVGLLGPLVFRELINPSVPLPTGPVTSAISIDGLVLWTATGVDGSRRPFLVNQWIENEGAQQVMYTSVALSVLDGLVYPVVIDPTYTLQPDATAGLDNWLYEPTPTLNNGTSVDLYIGEDASSASRTRTLIKFDFSAIPASDVCTSAILSLWQYADQSANARTFRVYRQLRDWVEAQATWNIYKTSNNWATAGGFGAADCEQTDIGSLAMSATEANGEKQWTLTNAGVEGMWDGGLTNNGFLIMADTELNDRYVYRSSDYATAGERPKLVIITTVGSSFVPRVMTL
jgi:hypothetical protein